MSVTAVGAIAFALAVTCVVLAPVGVPRTLVVPVAHPELAVLRDAGWSGSLLRWEGLRVAAVVCGLAVAGALGMPPLGFAGAAIPSVIVRVRAGRRRAERARQTVDLLQMVVASLRSGTSLTEALRVAVASVPTAVASPFAEAVRAFDLGEPLAVALRASHASARDHQVGLGLDALSLCAAEQLPASRCLTLIGSVVERLVFEQRMADDVRARTSGLRAQIALLAALVPGLALYLALTVPGLAETLSTPLGRFVLLPLASIFEVAGILASKHVVSDIA
jgi:Flp pilus assembly protein TadB